MKLSIEVADTVIAAAKAAVAKHACPPVGISVVDDAAHLVGFARMDGTFIGAIDLSHRKARTAALFHVDGAILGANLRPTSAAYTVENSNGGLVAIGGGVVLRNGEGLVIGAVGVSGATVDEDEIIAQAAAAAVAG